MRKTKISIGRIILNAVMIIISLGYILPILLMISISFSSEKSITDFGYQLIPNMWSTDAYKMIFKNPYHIR